MNLLLHVSLHLVFFEKQIIDYIEDVYFNPISGIKYIVVTTKYLMKWAKEKIVKANDAKKIIKFFYK